MSGSGKLGRFSYNFRNYDWVVPFCELRSPKMVYPGDEVKAIGNLDAKKSRLTQIFLQISLPLFSL